MALATLSVDELRRRLAVDPTDAPDPVLESCLSVASANIDPRCDLRLVNDYPDAYREGCYQLAVKVFDTQSKGATSMTPDGYYEAPSLSATSGMIRAVYGVLGPCLRTGGLGFG
jgi:hypothetical protein